MPTPDVSVAQLAILAQQGHWLFFGATILMVVVWATRNYILPKMGNGATRYLTLALGAVGGAVAALLGLPPGSPWTTYIGPVLTGALSGGAGGIGLWEAAGKKLLPASAAQTAASELKIMEKAAAIQAKAETLDKAQDPGVSGR